MNTPAPIQTIVVNLKKRTDRKAHIIKEFEGRTGFRVTIAAAIEDSIGARGLWQTLQRVIRTYGEQEEYIIICEDDHQFTSNYTPELLASAIQDALANNADILSGGPSWFNCALQAGPHIYWTEKYSGLQFTVIFKKAYPKILTAEFSDNEAVDFKICSLTENKFFIYPFISVQKAFGYSDVTPKNNVSGRVDELFKASNANVPMIKNVTDYYSKNTAAVSAAETATHEFCITTYVVPATNGDIEEYIDTHFYDKPELTPVIVEPEDSQPHRSFSSGAVLKDIIAMAESNEEDVIIICDDFHRFSPAYSGHYLIRNILEAHEQGADVLFGGGNDFGLVVPVSENRFWTGSVTAPQFIVVFKPAFSKLLAYADDPITTGEDSLSAFSSNKMVLCPFISAGDPFAETRLMNIRERYEQQKSNH